MVDKGSECYSGSMKSWLEKNDVEMFSTYNEATSVIAERFIRSLKIKSINTCMTSTWKNVYIDKLDYIFNKYNDTYHRTIKIKSVDVWPSTYIEK